MSCLSKRELRRTPELDIFRRSKGLVNGLMSMEGRLCKGKGWRRVMKICGCYG